MEEGAKILALDVEYNSFSGVVYQVGAARLGASGEIQIFDGITSDLFLECCEDKVNKRFFEARSRVLIGSFPILLQSFLDFAGGADYILTWGAIDGVILAREAGRHCLDLEKEVFSTYFDKFVNLQDIFSKRKNKPTGGYHLENALKVLGIETVGVPHVAPNDAYNTLLIAQKLVKNNKAYSATMYGNKLWGYLQLSFDEWLCQEERVSVPVFCSDNMCTA